MNLENKLAQYLWDRSRVMELSFWESFKENLLDNMDAKVWNDIGRMAAPPLDYRPDQFCREYEF